MTNQQHPIIPPPELVQQWVNTYFGWIISQSNFHLDLATRAAQWGANQELEACCQHVQKDVTEFTSHAHLCAQRKSDGLRAARRPKPPSLKEQALLAIDTAVADYRLSANAADVVRRALEQLDD